MVKKSLSKEELIEQLKALATVEIYTWEPCAILQLLQKSAR